MTRRSIVERFHAFLKDLFATTASASYIELPELSTISIEPFESVFTIEAFYYVRRVGCTGITHVLNAFISTDETL